MRAASVSNSVEISSLVACTDAGHRARGYHSSPWVQNAAVPGAHAARAAGYLMQAQIGERVAVSTTMTYGAIAALRRDPSLARDWVPRLLTREYDSPRHPLREKARRPDRHGHDGKARRFRRARKHHSRGPLERRFYRITGHKWFFSAPQCDAHLVLAQSGGGLSCFFMPRRLPDGSLNGIYIQRLKEQTRQSL